MSMLDEYVFLIVVNINQDRVFFAAFCQCCCPVHAFFACEIAETVEVAPSWITYICKKKSFDYVYVNHSERFSWSKPVYGICMKITNV